MPDGGCYNSAMNSELVVTPNAHLTLHYRLAVGVGAQVRELVTTFGQKPATLQLGCGQLSPGLEARLMGMREGDHAVLELAPGEAFGPRNPEYVQVFVRRVYDQQIDPTHAHAVGDLVEIPVPQGGYVQGTLKELDDERAVFDFNHPLAGQPVTFEVDIVGIIA